MFKFFLFNFLLIASSAQAMEITWDDHELGNDLHVFVKGKDKTEQEWTGREAQKQDLIFYRDLFGNKEVVKLMRSGEPESPETVETWVDRWVERLEQGKPFAPITILQGEKPVGFASLGILEKRPGVGQIARAFIPSVQGKGLGTSALKFLVEDWAPAIHKIGVGDESTAPTNAVDKFKCFGGKELQTIYASARPSNPGSWQCYKHFDFHPTPVTNTTFQITCEEWEDSQHGSLEEYIIQKHFSQTSHVSLQTDMLYNMLDEKSSPRTLSFFNEYGSLRYHFEREIK